MMETQAYTSGLVQQENGELGQAMELPTLMMGP
mgnify:CR=1